MKEYQLAQKNIKRIKSIDQEGAKIIDWMGISENRLKVLVHYKKINTFTIENVIWERYPNSLEETPEFFEIAKAKTLEEIKRLF